MTAIQCQPQRTIRFYGPLAKVLGRRSFSAIGLNSASEVMRCLLSNFPQLGGHMRGRHYRVVMNGRAISGDELNDPVGIGHEIHIIPAICGAGGGPLTTILTGVALIGAGLIFPFASSFLTPLGIGLVLQGVAEMISPTPNDTPESTDPSNRSYNFSGLQQTSREGVPVPLVYGEIVTGSIVLSVNIERDDEELDEIFDPGPGNPTPGIPAFPNPDPNGCFRIKQVVDWGIRPECQDYYIQYPPLGIRTNISNQQYSSIDITPVSVSASAPPWYFICQHQGTFGVMTTFNVVQCNSDNPTTRSFQAVAMGGQNYPASINYYRVYPDGSTVLIVELNYNVDYFGVQFP